MQEIWKDIKGYEGKYQVSNLGRVRSLYDQNQFKKNSRIKILKLGERNGYSVINLQNKFKPKERKSYQVHRLVAEAFIPNPENKPIINHIDENKKNNIVTNLEWCTQKENVLHSKYKMYKPKKSKLPTSGEKYIIKRNKYNKTFYEICIYKNGKHIYLGRKNSLNEAILLRNKYI